LAHRNPPVLFAALPPKRNDSGLNRKRQITAEYASLFRLQLSKQIASNRDEKFSSQYVCLLMQNVADAQRVQEIAEAEAKYRVMSFARVRGSGMLRLRVSFAGWGHDDSKAISARCVGVGADDRGVLLRRAAGAGAVRLRRQHKWR
jgi:hypothetical protein